MLRAALLKLGSFGDCAGSTGQRRGGDAEAIAALVRQGQALLKMSGPRLDQGAALRTQPAAIDQRGRREQLVARMRAVFGAAFVVLPHSRSRRAEATELARRLPASTARKAAIRWPCTPGSPAARECATVSATRLRACSAPTCSEPAHGSNSSVAQLPFVAQRTLGRRAAGAGHEMPPSKLSLVRAHHRSRSTRAALTGLLVDEWVEIVPSTRETTALAFQFDVPDSCAPQSVLIAVPPVPGQDWTTETLRRVLMETLDLAKLRAVDPKALGAAAQHLPGLYVAFNTEDHAVSTDFAPLTS